jgi:hypothetical protein
MKSEWLASQMKRLASAHHWIADNLPRRATGFTILLFIDSPSGAQSRECTGGRGERWGEEWVTTEEGKVVFFISALFYFGKFLYYARKNVFDVFIPKFFFKALVFFQILFQFSEFLRAGFQ